MWNCHSNSLSSRSSSGPATSRASAAPQTTQRANSYNVSWNPIVLDFPIVEPRYCQDIPLCIDADVGRSRHIAYERHHVAATMHDVHRRIRPARHEDVAIGQDL